MKLEISFDGMAGYAKEWMASVKRASLSLFSLAIRYLWNETSNSYHLSMVS